MGESLPGKREIGRRASIQRAQSKNRIRAQPLGTVAGLVGESPESDPSVASFVYEPFKVHAVELEDRITIQTPEGVELELTLAGLGSRATATIIDGLIKAGVLFAALIFSWMLSGLSENSAAIATAFISLTAFALLIVYDITFEVLNSGKTPGKRAAGIRVVTSGGGPIRFTGSAIRNILRIVDFLPGMYFIGIVAIVITPNHQRLGDLAAGSLVIRDRRPTSFSEQPQGINATQPSGSWDVSGIDAREVAVVRQFLERRADLDPATRDRLARQIAEPLRRRVVGPSATIDAEEFLERLAAEKASRG